MGFDLVASDEIPIAVADTTPPVIISGLFRFKIIFKSTSYIFITELTKSSEKRNRHALVSISN